LVSVVLLLSLVPVISFASEETLPIELAELLPEGGEDYRLRIFGEDQWWFPEEAFYLEEMNPAGVWMRGESRAEVLVIRPEGRETLRLRLRSISVGNVFRVTAEEETLHLPFAEAPRRKPVPVELSLGEPVMRLEDATKGDGSSVYLLQLESTHGVVPRDRNPKSSETRNLGTFVSPR